MPLYVPPGYANVIHSMNLTADPEPIAVTYGVSIDDPETADYQAIVNALRNAFVTQIGDFIATGYAHRQTELQVGTADNTDRPVWLNTTAAAFTGTNAGLPQNCAYLVHKRSNKAGRKHRGRLYIPGVQELEVGITGVLSTVLFNAAQPQFNDWLTAINGVAGVGSMVIFHSTETLAGGTTGLPVDPPTPVTSLVLDPVIATQRRRLRK